MRHRKLLRNILDSLVENMRQSLENDAVWECFSLISVPVNLLGFCWHVCLVMWQMGQQPPPL